MKTHDIVRGNVEHWLQKNKKSCQWLDDKIGVSPTMIQHRLLEKGPIRLSVLRSYRKLWMSQ